jgi:O-acetyl-ADP-ribose deacetylase (regulator of RNase III)
MTASSPSERNAAYAAGLARLQVVVGDITRATVDAIVNAANEALAGGGGVDGAIHAAAGKEELARACRALPELRPGVRCPTGEARITSGFRLPARHIIHTVGPVWHGGQQGEAELLASCYTRSVELARAHQLATLAFPAISTGVFGYPVEAACQVAVNALAEVLGREPAIESVSLFAFGEPTARALRAALDVSRQEASRQTVAELPRPRGSDHRSPTAAGPVAVVNAWLDAVNAGDVDRVLAWSAPEVEIVGPRGAARGHDVLRQWIVRAGASFVTLGVKDRGEQVVAEQLGVWRTDAAPREARLVTRFVVRDGRVQLLQRYDSLEQALLDAEVDGGSRSV